ncbi:Late expression factor 10 lef-10 [Spodoptera exigua multiple nucleopolyhedrovirus]|uniref:ORF106 lef10 n=1 Tax=Spodoptera exigua nuclear polyhedrosis virus (strain US) TaxID=31506 RepID=Q9J831_NPVSE|nr:ORF106 lef10 [Spodoptera exigua multiple nucleopolyhedrovirus]AAF33635.1 ORF106 lef10 [Spodoptera exigua multiple nucleopolyhedrovirus]CDG72446.1 Late expression factor 10 lef-10 [Spodoptera exigua multiple nucleopolyhedrovirus]CDG72583.1 Late expression factor 10 lef-10 [Spodoptera exigua multiple nucleopolyhedrovirus]CDG72720.1 Late expression factor 10 lef-10 [Spodoptera exigua multiple nucleopolyhedrovirus]CDG72857.1 Late expression factor 10 lef-10 [Spodoptera exigua multiple nucleopol
MSSVSIANDVLNAILSDNLELIDDSYIILNVVDHESSGGTIKPVCIGEINSFQTNQSDKYPVSDSSVSSELQSDQTL